MLARNFKSAKALGLSQIDYDGLVKALGAFEREEVVSFTMDTFEHPKLFNMMCWHTKTAECGTMGCIAGWASELTNGEAFSWVRADYHINAIAEGLEKLPANLRILFIPNDHVRHELSRITTSQAAQALRNFLATGDANWEAIL